MRNSGDEQRRVTTGDERQRRGSTCLALALLTASLTGCAALHPLDGVPARYFPDELKGELRSGKETIDLSRLGQLQPAAYRIDRGDVLGIYVEGVLGKRDDVPPVYFPTTGDIPPTLGYPIPVRDDGTVSLPLIDPISVRGMTVRHAEDTIRRAYTHDRQILQPGRDRILVSLQKARTYQVLVLRQETMNSGGAAGSGQGSLNPGLTKHGTGQQVTLPAYQNDVLHALAQTGGLPGLDAQNAIYVIRRRPSGPPLPPHFNYPLQSQTGRSDIQTVSGETTSRSSSGSGMFPWLFRGGHSTPVAQSTPPSPTVPGPMGPALDLDSGSGTVFPQPGGRSAVGPPRDLISPQRPTNGSMLPPPPNYGPPPSAFVPPGAGFSEPQFDPNQTGVDSPYGQPLPPPLRSDRPAAPGFGPQGMEVLPPGANMPQLPPELAAYGNGTQVVRIPIRLPPGEVAHFTEQDIILGEGDIVFIESRETEIFYTGGLLGGGQYTLPRDYDLDVLGAISIASSRQQGGSSGQGFGNRIGGIAAINQDISVGASDVVVLRQMPDGSQIPIKVDLTKALRDPQERILIQPGDYIILQYKPLEAVGAFIERNILAGSLIGLAAAQMQSGGGGN